MTRTDSLFFRALEPDEGWLGQKEATGASQRARMLDAVTRAVADKGYARVTVGDVVERGGRFAPHLLRAVQGQGGLLPRRVRDGYRRADRRTWSRRRSPSGADADWREVLNVAIDTYVGGLAADPAFARTFLVDVLGAGPAAVELRRQVYEQFVQQYVVLARRAAKQQPEIGEVPVVYLRALVGGIGELVQQHLLTEGREDAPRAGARPGPARHRRDPGRGRPRAHFALARK